MNTALRVICALSLCAVITSPGWAYQTHDLRKIVRTERADGKARHSLDLRAVDAVIRDLSPHAFQYPPQFASAQEAQAARADAEALSGMLNVLASDGATDPALLIRVAKLNTLAHNLDVTHAARRADAAYEELIRQAPNQGGLHLEYGVFLASSSRLPESVHVLSKALALGMPAANFPLGMALLAQRKPKEALAHLRQYRQQFPQDERTAEIIEAIMKNQVSVKEVRGRMGP